MKVYLYHAVNPDNIPGYDKFVQAITADNFMQADVRKIDTNLYRARLNLRDRLLFSFYRYDDETVCLVLEYLPNHAYHRSKFIRKQVVIDEARLQPVLSSEDVHPEPIAYINPHSKRLYRLDKMLSFDDEQQALYEHPLPLIIAGTAGSGKTALVLEKMKQATGDILYLSLSSFLVERARTLYSMDDADNETQHIDFLSLREFIESLKVPSGHEVTFNAFSDWLPRNKSTAALGSAHTLFEEFRGVIGATLSEEGPLTREAYLALGVKQSLYPADIRPDAYTLFEQYLSWLSETGQYDTNLLSHHYLPLATPRYDYLFIDEVQDMTPVQLYLVLKTLRKHDQFLLCGDTNQVVHPNFFSWAKLKSLFFQFHAGSDASIQILQASYRNSPRVTALANRLLILKQRRFGSIDRESHYLVHSCGQEDSVVSLLEDNESVKEDINSKTARSARVAVLVMYPEQKAAAKRWFKTPLIFCVQEAKGLEYETVILFNLVSDTSQAFDEICEGIIPDDLDITTLNYRRPKDKQDRSAERYKFFINALYVAMTRATKDLYLVEQRCQHPLWSLLALSGNEKTLSLKEDVSSRDEWQKAAHQLALQGKQEQADAIREQVLQQQTVPWAVIDRTATQRLFGQVKEGLADKHTKLQALEYALLYSAFPLLNLLCSEGFRPALQAREKGLHQLEQKYFRPYTMNNPVAVLRDVARYGVDHRTPFNLTPLMIAARVGNTALVHTLLEQGANPLLTGNDGLCASHYVLSQAVADPRYARQKSGELYALLKPDSVSIQADGRLIKLDNRHMGAFLLQLMQALFYSHLGNALIRGGAFSAAMLAECVSELPETLLPQQRKRQSYISSQLSQHEVFSRQPYNKKLFFRLRRGQYVLNPALKIRQGEQWLDLHALLPLEAMGGDISQVIRRYHEHKGEVRNMALYLRERYDNIREHWVTVIQEAAR